MLNLKLQVCSFLGAGGNDWLTELCSRPLPSLQVRVPGGVEVCSTHAFSTSWCPSTLFTSPKLFAKDDNSHQGSFSSLFLHCRSFIWIVSGVYVSCFSSTQLLTFTMATSTLLSRSGSRLLLQSTNSRLSRSAASRLQSVTLFVISATQATHLGANP